MIDPQVLKKALDQIWDRMGIIYSLRRTGWKLSNSPAYNTNVVTTIEKCSISTIKGTKVSGRNKTRTRIQS